MRIHEAWLNKQTKDDPKPAMVPWVMLDDEYKESNRAQARDILVKLGRMGYKAVPVTGRPIKLLNFKPAEVERMAIMEHERWVAEKKAMGWSYGTPRNNVLKLHPMLLDYDELTEEQKELDRDPVRRIPEQLMGSGYEVARDPKRAVRSSRMR